MTDNTQKLSIRLLKDGFALADSVRDGVHLADWEKLEGAKISLDTMGGYAPKWARFLELSDEDKKKVFNNTAYGLIFLEASNRWFAVSFGMGHVKLDPAKFEQDFGLRIVLNAVDPKQLKSADVRTPDENTLSRRSQTSRGSDQSAFAIDIERDIVRGLVGTPKDLAFASRVAGTDALSMDRKMTAADLNKACSDAYRMYQETGYKKHFSWIDQIKHIREVDLVVKLNSNVIIALDTVVKGGDLDGLHLAFPVIYDPEHFTQLRYKGFRSSILFPDLEIEGYLQALNERGKAEFTVEDFNKHSVHEVDDLGRDCGGKWKIAECLVHETELDGYTYVLSGGRWYQIDKNLAKEVQAFFQAMPRHVMPDALADENEEKYNARLKTDEAELLCLDRKLITPTGANTAIEVCDFLDGDRRLIHVKDKTSSSRLSHLFNQGTVSGRILILDGQARDKVRKRIAEVQSDTGQIGFDEIIGAAGADFHPADFTVVYAVIGTGVEEKLPFFSMVTLRQAARELQALGYKSAFSWIKKPPAAGMKKASKASDPDNVSAVLVEAEAAE